MAAYSYTRLEEKAKIPVKIGFVSSPAISFHTEVITRFAHHPSRKVFQVCSVEHILWTRQSLNQGKVFTLSCICRIWFVYFHKFTFLWIRRERGRGRKDKFTDIIPFFYAQRCILSNLLNVPAKKDSHHRYIFLVSLRISTPWSEWKGFLIYFFHRKCMLYLDFISMNYTANSHSTKTDEMYNPA